MKKNSSDKTMLVIVLFAVILSIAATAIFTPSLPIMADSFGVGEGMIKQTLSIYLFGLACSSFFYGPMSDSYGRRSIFLFGLVLFVAGSIGCFLAPSISFLYCSRLLQGFGGGVAPVLGVAMARDRYHGQKMARVTALITLGIAVSPAIAPVVGGYLTAFLGWRSNFIVIALLGAVLLAYSYFALKETLEREHRHEFSFKAVLRVYRRFLSSSHFLSYTFFSAAMFAGLWAFLATAPFVLIEEIGISIVDYGYYTALLVGFYFLFGLISTRLLSFLAVEKILWVGVVISALGSLLLIISGIFFAPSLIAIGTAMFFYQGGRAFIMPMAISLAMEAHHQNKGIAAAVMKAIEMSSSGLAIVAISFFGRENLVAAGLVMFGFLLFACLFYGFAFLSPKKRSLS